MSQTTDAETPATDLPFPEQYKRPSLEEFVAAGYKGEEYEAYFARYEAELRKAPALKTEFFLVHSRVRHVTTRTARAKSPARHRFKQFLFGDPALRLIRKRPLRLSAAQVQRGLNELIEREKLGLLVVTTTDGRKVDLVAMRFGVLSAAPAHVVASPPQPPLDSIANDAPWGENRPQYVDGTFYGDPVAERALQDLISEKQDALPEEPSPDAEPSDTELDPMLEGAEFTDPVPQPDPAPEPQPEPQPTEEDPAAARAAERASEHTKGGKKGRRP